MPICRNQFAYWAFFDVIFYFECVPMTSTAITKNILFGILTAFQEAISERTKEVPKLVGLTYVHTLVMESTHKYNVCGPYGSDLPRPIGARGGHGTWQVGTIWPTDHVFMNTFTDQSMDIGCVAKLWHLSGSLGDCLLKTK